LADAAAAANAGASVAAPEEMEAPSIPTTSQFKREKISGERKMKYIHNDNQVQWRS
jgi:hypothetical protein